MSLVTVGRYRELTKDEDSPNEEIASLLAGAQSIVEDYLHRYLESDERTETLTVYRGGRVYPSATPITAVGDGYEIDGYAIIGASPAFPDYWDTPSYVGQVAQVTYTGGYTADNVPYSIELGIARVAKYLLGLVSTDSLDPGIKRLSVEGYSVEFAGPTVHSTGDTTADNLLKPYRKRLVA